MMVPSWLCQYGFAKPILFSCIPTFLLDGAVEHPEIVGLKALAYVC
jgi:hypothetical protein